MADIDWTDRTLRPLDELARIAFPVDSGVTADTLKRRARQGKLVVYRPGKPYMSTLADVWAMVQLTRVGHAPPRPTSAVPNPLGLTEMELSSLALDQALEGSTKQEPDRPKRGQRKEAWLEYEARKAARQPPRRPK